MPRDTPSDRDSPPERGSAAAPRPHVVAVPGSLRDASRTRVVCRRALAAAETAGASTDLVDLREHDLPVYDGDRPDAGDAPGIRRRLREADACLLGTPVYHHSYASPLKTVLDYCRFAEFEATLVGVLAVAGGGAGGAPSEALGHLRGVVHGLRGRVHPRQVVVPHASETVVGGELADPDLADRIDEFAAGLVDRVREEASPMAAPVPAP